MMICKKCGTENADNASVCAKCGNPLKAVSKPKNNFLDVSLCSGLIIAFSVLALIFLILPSTRSVSYTEYEGNMEQLDEKTANEVLSIVRDDITIDLERKRIDNYKSGERKNEIEADIAKFTKEVADLEEELAKLKKNNASEEEIEAKEAEKNAKQEKLDLGNERLSNIIQDAVWKQKWSVADAVDILEGIGGNETNISKIRELDSKVKDLDAKIAEIDAKISEIDQKIEELGDSDPSQTSTLQTEKANEEAKRPEFVLQRVQALDDRDTFVNKVINDQNPDKVNRGAIGAVIREHRDTKDATNTVITILSILLAISLVITIISWVTRLYRARIFATIANAVFAFLSFILPVAVWTMDTKWPFEVSKYITYGISFGSTFVWVLIFSVATLFASLAYFADDLFGKKN